MTDLEEVPDMPHPMPRLPESHLPLPSRQGLVTVSPVQARYYGAVRGYAPTHGVIHMTAGASLRSSEEWANRPNVPPPERASWHLGIERFGHMRRFLSYDLIAYHAGRSSWPEIPDVRGSINHATIGIELANLNDGREAVPYEQYLSAVWAAAVLSERFGFPGSRWLGHHEVSPGRKSDPHPNVFSMRAFRADVVEELSRRRRHRAEHA